MTDPYAASGAQPPESGSSSSSPGGTDPLTVIAVVTGLIGLVLVGIVCAVITALLASEAGRKARAERRSQENAVVALGLAVLDGVVWLVLQIKFELPFWVG